MKLIVLSLDAVGFNDILQSKNLFPNLHTIIDNGTLLEDVETITPSLTYPIHTTMITGEYPSVHGIDHNVFFQPFEENLKWNWHYKNIKSPTIIDELRKVKKTTTSIFWPVTAGAKIHRCIPEIWDFKSGKTKLSLMLKNGSISFILKEASKHRKLLNGKETVALDNFTYNVFMDLLKSDTLSDLSLIHFLSVDGAKHLYGNYSVHAKNAFITLDTYIGNIYNEIKHRDDITLAILSDHTQIDTKYNINIEKIFKEKGLLFKGDYLAYPRSCDGSCLVHIKNSTQKPQIKNKLKKIVSTTKGIKKLYDLDEDTNISNEAYFLLDAEDGYCFSDSSEYVGQHGYHSDRSDYGVFLILAGKHIKKSHKIKNESIVNYAKTFAKILDVPFEHGDSKCIEEIFEE